MKRFTSRPGDQLVDPVNEARLFRRRAVFMGVFAVVLLSVLIARLYFLQVRSYEHYQSESTNNRVHVNALAPARGLIFDRRGVVLAHNLPSFQLEITREDVDDLEATLSGIADYVSFDENDVARFRKAMRRAPPFQGVALRSNLSEEEVARFSVVKHRFPGVDIVARLRRHYPGADTAGHVIGYVGRIDEDDLQTLDPVNYRATREIGKLGIEREFESLLHGTVGHQQVEVNVAGRVLRVLEEEPPTPGAGVYLTLDMRLQHVASEALGDENGAVVAINPATGEVLAMVSKPDFDINLFIDGISVANYKKLRDDWRRPMFNRALAGTYPPGSTIKPIMSLAALETNTLTRYSKVYCPGYYSLPGDDHRYRDWKRVGHGHMNLNDAVAQSCDVMFYDVANKLGVDLMTKWFNDFGFGHPTGIDIHPERSGIAPSREWKQKQYGQVWYPGETLIAGIGQGYFTATPLQLAHSTGILAMRGKIVRPHLLYAVQDNPAQAPQLQAPEVLRQLPVKDETNWDYVIKSMVNVVSGKRGTARRAFAGAAYTVAGKTGTAQVFTVEQDAEYDKELIEKRLQDHALFVAFAPVEDPQIAVSVVVENGGSGSAVAAPIARRVLDAWLVGEPGVSPPMKDGGQHLTAPKTAERSLANN
ncbi:penicillin-binding protein 2 [Granulosicoccaceae sp. 1_MG-2023]|nr:penicillin-binding protein 2 [Granulosicoccaceae sp. 1_MG-2023]